MGAFQQAVMTTRHTSTQEPADDPSPESAELMYVKCSGCGKWMDVKPGHINSISHSLCPECYAREMRKLEQGGADPRDG